MSDRRFHRSFRLGRIIGGYVDIGKDDYSWGWRFNFEIEVTRWND